MSYLKIDEKNENAWYELCQVKCKLSMILEHFDCEFATKMFKELDKERLKDSIVILNNILGLKEDKNEQ